MDFLDEFVENVSVGESKIKDDISDCETNLIVIEDEIDILNVNLNMAYMELVKNPAN